jgi:putative hydrolase of the HAD superfamily
MAIRAAVFDLGGVLEMVDDDRWQLEWAARWEDHAGRPRGALDAGADARTRAALNDGSITEAQSVAWFSRALGLSAKDADRMLAEMWDEYCGVLDVPLYDLVVELRQTMKTAVLSNSVDGARREEQQRFELASIFDVLVYSHEVGCAKPDPKIYRLTEDLLGVSPDEIVFLDDRPEHVRAARSCGWHAILHTDTPASIAAIRRRIADPSP